MWSVLTPSRSQTASRLDPSSAEGKPSPSHSCQHLVGSAKRGRVVDDRAAAETGTRDQPDTLVVGCRGAAAAVEAAQAGPLGAVEVALRPVAARLEHDHVQSGRSENRGRDTAAGARADHADVALQLQLAVGLDRLEPWPRRVSVRSERPRVADRLPAAGKHVRERERGLPESLEAGPHQRDRAVAPAAQDGFAPRVREPRVAGKPRPQQELQPLPLTAREVVLHRIEHGVRDALLDRTRRERLADRVERAHSATLRRGS